MRKGTAEKSQAFVTNERTPVWRPDLSFRLKTRSLFPPEDQISLSAWRPDLSFRLKTRSLFPPEDQISLSTWRPDLSFHLKTRSLFPPEDQISLSACHIVAARKSFIGLLWNSASQCFKKICRACAICVTNKLSESCTLCSYVVDLLIAGCTVFDRFGWNSVYTISSCCHSETVIFAKLCRVKPIHYISVSMEFCQYFFTTRLCIG